MIKQICFAVLVLSLLLVFGCTDIRQTEFASDAERFQHEYMSINGKYDDYGQKMRSVSIADNNPTVYASYADIISRIKDDSSFAVYFGFAKCPWCRGSLEAMLESAENNHLDLIYYVDVYNTRDTYEIKDGIAVKTENGSSDYEELLSLLSPVLSDYILEDDDGTQIPTGEKRIYAPTVIVIKNGEAAGIAADSPLFTDPYADISDAIYSDMIANYNDLFVLIAS